MKSLMLTSAMILAAPALAQTAAPTPATPSASTNAAQPAQPVTDAPSTAAPATVVTPSAQPAPVTNPSDAVAAVVAADWEKYDADKSDNLSKAEFTAWMTALRESNPAQKAQVTDVGTWTKAAFAQADKDKSNSVTKPELEGFLKG